MVKIGINGFGRLGRQLLKIAINKCKQKCATDVSRVVMVNDATVNPEQVTALLRRDSIYGPSNMEIVEMGKALLIDGQRVEFSNESKIDKIPWKNVQAEYVIDTTGQNITCEKASMFLTEGIKRVIVTGCTKVPVFVIGVNHCCFTEQMKTVSVGTPQLNCIMPILRVLHENFHLIEATSLAIQPFCNMCHILDDSSPHGSTYYKGAIECLTPIESTISSKHVARIMPELDQRTASTSVRIPVPCVGALDMTVKLGKEAPYEAIKCKLKEAADTYMKGIITIAKDSDDLCSCDVIGDPSSCIFDPKAGLSLTKCVAKVFVWHDCEFGFAQRLYDLANYMSSREKC